MFQCCILAEEIIPNAVRFNLLYAIGTIKFRYRFMYMLWVYIILNWLIWLESPSWRHWRTEILNYTSINSSLMQRVLLLHNISTIKFYPHWLYNIFELLDIFLFLLNLILKLSLVIQTRQRDPFQWVQFTKHRQRATNINNEVQGVRVKKKKFFKWRKIYYEIK